MISLLIWFCFDLMWKPHALHISSGFSMHFVISHCWWLLYSYWFLSNSQSTWIAIGMCWIKQILHFIFVFFQATFLVGAAIVWHRRRYGGQWDKNTLNWHCKLATLSRRQKPMLPGRRYFSMLLARRQSLQFYNFFIQSSCWDIRSTTTYE